MKGFELVLGDAARKRQVLRAAGKALAKVGDIFKQAGAEPMNLPSTDLALAPTTTLHAGVGMEVLPVVNAAASAAVVPTPVTAVPVVNVMKSVSVSWSSVVPLLRPLPISRWFRD